MKLQESVNPKTVRLVDSVTMEQQHRNLAKVDFTVPTSVLVLKSVYIRSTVHLVLGNLKHVRLDGKHPTHQDSGIIGVDSAQHAKKERTGTLTVLIVTLVLRDSTVLLELTDLKFGMVLVQMSLTLNVQLCARWERSAHDSPHIQHGACQELITTKWEGHQSPRVLNVLQELIITTVDKPSAKLVVVVLLVNEVPLYAHALGLNRYFLTSDGSCRCKSGFVYYDETETMRTDGNSNENCQRTVEERCQANELRVSASRKCVVPQTYDCKEECGDSGGVLKPETGRCECSRFTEPWELCDDECVRNKPKISVKTNTRTGKAEMEVNYGDVTRTISLTNSYGLKEYDTQVRDCQVVSFSESGFEGKVSTEHLLVKSQQFFFIFANLFYQVIMTDEF